MIYKRGFLGGGVVWDIIHQDLKTILSRSQDYSIKISRLFYLKITSRLFIKTLYTETIITYSNVILFMYLLSGRHVFRKASKTGLFTRDKFSETS